MLVVALLLLFYMIFGKGENSYEIFEKSGIKICLTGARWEKIPMAYRRWPYLPELKNETKPGSYLMYITDKEKFNKEREKLIKLDFVIMASDVLDNKLPLNVLSVSLINKLNTIVIGEKHLNDKKQNQSILLEDTLKNLVGDRYVFLPELAGIGCLRGKIFTACDEMDVRLIDGIKMRSDFHRKIFDDYDIYDNILIFNQFDEPELYKEILKEFCFGPIENKWFWENYDYHNNDKNFFKRGEELFTEVHDDITYLSVRVQEFIRNYIDELTPAKADMETFTEFLDIAYFAKILRYYGDDIQAIIYCGEVHATNVVNMLLDLGFSYQKFKFKPLLWYNELIEPIERSHQDIKLGNLRFNVHGDEYEEFEFEHMKQLADKIDNNFDVFSKIFEPAEIEEGEVQTFNLASEFEGEKDFFESIIDKLTTIYNERFLIKDNLMVPLFISLLQIFKNKNKEKKYKVGFRLYDLLDEFRLFY